MSPLSNVKPAKGVEWRVGAFRIDYDGGKPRLMAWRDTGLSFHNHHRYGTFRFV
jgi:hypothetical protein